MTLLFHLQCLHGADVIVLEVRSIYLYSINSSFSDFDKRGDLTFPAKCRLRSFMSLAFLGVIVI